MKNLRLIITCAFALNFLFGDITYALPPDKINTSVDNAETSKFNFDDFALPLSAGDIKNKFKGSLGKTVIHIQDAHCNYACQLKISDIINHLNTEYGVDVVDLEGGSGKYDLSLFTRIENPEVRAKITDHFVRSGLVNGAESFAINNPSSISLKGIEDPKLYYKDLNAYRDTLPYEKEIKPLFSGLSDRIEKAKMTVYSEELKSLDALRKKYKNNEVELKDYLAGLLAMARKYTVDTRAHVNILAIQTLVDSEKSINFKNAQKERTALIEKLLKTLSSAEQARLIKKTAENKEGDLSNDDFYKYLFNKARFVDIKEEGLPELTKYVKYIKGYDGIDKQSVYKELVSLEKELYVSLLTNDRQRDIFEMDKKIGLMRDMFDISLTKERYSGYKNEKDAYSVPNLQLILEKNGLFEGLSPDEKGSLSRLGGYLAGIELFYECSFERDTAFIGNIRSSFNDKNVAVLVTGGFHKDNLTELIRKEGLSYIEIIPKFTTDSSVKNNYKALLRGDGLDFDGFLGRCFAGPTSMSNIAIQSMFSEMGIADARNRNMVELQLEIMASVMRGETFRVSTNWGVIDFSPGTTGDFIFSSPGIDIAATVTFDVKAGGDVDIVLVDGATMTFEQHEIWIDRQLANAYAEARTRAAAETDVEAAAGFIERELGRRDVAEALRALSREGRVNIVEGIRGFLGHAGRRGIHISSDSGNIRATLIHEAMAFFFDAGHGFNEEAEKAYTALSGAPELAERMRAMPITPLDKRSEAERKRTGRDHTSPALEDSIAFAGSEVPLSFVKDLLYTERVSERLKNAFDALYQTMVAFAAAAKMRGSADADVLASIAAGIDVLISDTIQFSQTRTINSFYGPEVRQEDREYEIRKFRTGELLAKLDAHDIDGLKQFLKGLLDSGAFNADLAAAFSEIRRNMGTGAQGGHPFSLESGKTIPAKDIGGSLGVAYEGLVGEISTKLTVEGAVSEYDMRVRTILRDIFFVLRDGGEISSLSERTAGISELTRLFFVELKDRELTGTFSEADPGVRIEMVKSIAAMMWVREERNHLILKAISEFTLLIGRDNQPYMGRSLDDVTMLFSVDLDKEYPADTPESDARADLLEDISREGKEKEARIVRLLLKDKEFVGAMKEFLGTFYESALFSENGFMEETFLSRAGGKGNTVLELFKKKNWIEPVTLEEESMGRGTTTMWKLSGAVMDGTVPLERISQTISELKLGISAERVISFIGKIREKKGGLVNMRSLLNLVKFPSSREGKSSFPAHILSTPKRLELAERVHAAARRVVNEAYSLEETAFDASSVANRTPVAAAETAGANKDLEVMASCFADMAVIDAGVQKKSTGRRDVRSLEEIRASIIYRIEEYLELYQRSKAGESPDFLSRMIGASPMAPLLSLEENAAASLGENKERIADAITGYFESIDYARIIDVAAGSVGLDADKVIAYSGFSAVAANFLASAASAGEGAVISEDDGRIKVSAGVELTLEQAGGNYITGQFTEVCEKVNRFMFSDINSGEESYDFITANDIVTDEEGDPIDGAYTNVAKTRAAAQNYIGRHKTGTLVLDYNVGVENARKSVREMIARAREGVPQERMHYSIGESVLIELEADSAFKEEIGAKGAIRELLGGIVMLDVIKDSLKKKVDGREFTVVYLMPFGRVGFLGLTKLNLAHVAKQSPEDSEAIADAIKPLAYAMCLVSNNMDRINELDAFLKGQSAKDVNFYRKVFEVALPPIAKLNYEIIKECFEAEVEVLRSL